MNGTPIFRSAFRVALRFQWDKTKAAARLSFGSIFGRANPESSNPQLVYDHGMLLRLLRDIGILLALLIRVVFGVLTFLIVVPLLPPLLLLRFVLGVPLYALISASWMKYKTWRWLDGGK